MGSTELDEEQPAPTMLRKELGNAKVVIISEQEIANNVIYYLYVFSSHGALAAPGTGLWSPPAPLMVQLTFTSPWS